MATVYDAILGHLRLRDASVGAPLAGGAGYGIVYLDSGSNLNATADMIRPSEGVIRLTRTAGPQIQFTGAAYEATIRTNGTGDMYFDNLNEGGWVIYSDGDIEPLVNQQYSIGATLHRPANIYSQNFYGKIFDTDDDGAFRGAFIMDGANNGAIIFNNSTGYLDDSIYCTWNDSTNTLTATNIAASTQLNAQNATIAGNLINSSLTEGRIVYVGTSGILDDDTGLTWNIASKYITITTANKGLVISSTWASGNTVEISGLSDGGYGTRAPMAIFHKTTGHKTIGFGDGNDAVTYGLMNFYGWAAAATNGYTFGDITWFNTSGESLGNSDLRVGVLHVSRDGAANQSTFSMNLRNGTNFNVPIVIKYTTLVGIGNNVTSPGAQLQVTPYTVATKGILAKGMASQTGNLFEAQDSSSDVLWTISALGNHLISPHLVTSGAITSLTLTAPAHTGQTASTEVIDVNFNLNRTLQHAAGALATQRAFVIQAPTYSFVSASTITNAATFAVSAAPSAGANATLSNSYSLWIQAGTSRFDANISCGSGVDITSLDELEFVDATGDPSATGRLRRNGNDIMWHDGTAARDILNKIRKNSAGTVYTRPQLNLIEGSNVTLTVADDSTDNEIDVTIAASATASANVLFAQTATKEVVNTGTETTLTNTGAGSLTLAADYFTAGKGIRITARGYHSVAAGSPLLQIRTFLNTTTMGSTGALGQAARTSKYWEVSVTMTCYTTGATGTVWSQGHILMQTGDQTSITEQLYNASAITIDTTATQAVDLKVQWGTADAGNTVTCTNFIVETLTT